MPKRSTLRLTKRIVERLKADGKDAIFWDRDLAGFGVRVHTTGRKLYIVQSRGPAGLKRVTLGRVGTETIDERRREAAIVIDRIKRGEDPRPPEPALEPTVADLAELCLKNHVAVRCKPRTAKNYRLAIQHHILPALGTKALKDVEPEDVTALHHELRDRPAAANQAVWVLSKMFSLAELWELRPDGSNPCRHVKRFKEKKRERFLSDDEYQRLGSALREIEQERSETPAAITAIRLLMLTGCRLSEIQKLRWEHVDLEAGELKLPETKTGAKVVHLGEPAIAVLRGIERQGDNPWVIAGRKADSHLTDLQHPWRRIRSRAVLDDVRIHDLRHSFASGGLMVGEGLPMIGKLLGHTQVQTTARYAHLANDPVKSAANRIASRIAEVAG